MPGDLSDMKRVATEGQMNISNPFKTIETFSSNYLKSVPHRYVTITSHNDLWGK